MDRRMPRTPGSCMPSCDIDQFPVGMAYVPIQQYYTTFELCQGFHEGTIFPELAKPFCGKRGCC